MIDYLVQHQINRTIVLNDHDGVEINKKKKKIMVMVKEWSLNPESGRNDVPYDTVGSHKVGAQWTASAPWRIDSADSFQGMGQCDHLWLFPQQAISHGGQGRVLLGTNKCQSRVEMSSQQSEEQVGDPTFIDPC